MKLRLLFLLIPVMLLILALTLIIFKINEDRLLSALSANEVDRIDFFLDEVSEEFEHVRSMLSYLAAQSLVVEFASAGQPHPLSRLTDDFKDRYSRLIVHKPEFTSLAVIDIAGKELISLEKLNQNIIIRDDLIDYAHSRIVGNALKLDGSQLYAGMMELESVEGQILVPKQPVIDFFKVILNSKGERVGLLKVTFDAQRILKELDKAEMRSGVQFLLINTEGYFLKAKKEAEEWGIQLERDGKDNTFKTLYNGLWQQLQHQTSSQFEYNKKLYTTVNICDANPCQSLNANHSKMLGIISAGMPWTLISELDLSAAVNKNQSSPRWYLVYAMIAVLAAIAIISGMAGWRLITANRSLERARKESTGKDKLFRSFIDGNPSLVYAKDNKGKYTIANTAYAGFLNETPESLLGKSDFDLAEIDGELISQHITQEQLVLHSGEMTVKDEIWQHKTETDTHFVVSRFPVDIDADNEYEMVGVIAIDVTERDIARSEMAQKEAMFRTLVDASPNTILIMNNEGVINFANKEASKLFGWSQEDLIGKELLTLIPDDFTNQSPIQLKKIAENRKDGIHSIEHQTKAVTKRGEELSVDITLSTVHIKNSLMTMAIVRDVTGKLKMESHLRQSQKMEAIGQLTGGVAHDFNNLLGVIIGNLDLLGSMYPDDEQAQKRINGALKASLSGAELTKKLLAFARKQTLHPDIVDIGVVIEGMIPLLDRTLKGAVKLTINVAPNLSKAFIDSGEFENVILNMAINARDAMPKGGVFNIEADNVDLDELFIKAHDDSLTPGSFVHISLSDNGTGMPDEVIKHIFEPFYTTKEKGKGTGLGLSMTHGFVKQSKGMMRVYSEEGVGTSFHLFIPAAKGDYVKPQPKVTDINALMGNGETILVVDDEADLAEIASAYLEMLGYKTLSASSGEKALAILAEHSEIQLVITDIVMPGGMDGITLHKQIYESFPGIKVVYASGFSADALKSSRGHQIKVDLIQKPYRKENLAIVIKNNLSS